MMIKPSIALLALCVSQATAAESYDCTFGDIYGLSTSEDGVSESPIQFGQQTNPAWKFQIVHGENDASIIWPDSPLQFEGKAPLIQTGPESYATFKVSAGPCMFTEYACGASLHYAKQPDGSLLFHFQPIALTKMSDDRRIPLKVLAEGSCSLTEEAQ